jgi:MYXO-CTERM domain-containing protein
MWILSAFAAELALPDWAVTHRWAEPDAYFVGGARPELGFGDGPPDYDLADVHAILYVPDGEPPPQGWAVYVHLDADDEPALPEDWQQVFTDRRVIYIAPRGVGNATSVPLRVAWALDALASVEAGWPVDPDRRAIGGFSGGGAVAASVGAHWPEVFVGVLDMNRAVMWELHDISTMPGYAFGMDEVAHLDPDWLDTIRDGPRFAFVSGERDWLGDFSNYEGIMDGIGDWWARGLRTRVFDVPGLGHEPSPGGPLDAALAWTLDCADDGRFPPRFDTDHMPPATPFPTPEAAPPDPCDPIPPEEPEAPSVPEEPEEPEAGCGCQAVPSPAGWLWLGALGALRRRQKR